MSHQDLDGRELGCQADGLRRAVEWLVPRQSLGQFRFRDDCTWTPWQLVFAALVWAWSDELTLVERFHTARRIVEHTLAPQSDLAGSYQAFLKLLARWTARLVTALQTVLRGRMRQALPDRWQQQGLVIFGVDGSRIELPRTKSHEQAYAGKRPTKRRRRGKQSAAARARKAHTPQMWLTTVWHAGTGLPWDWRIGPADSSEREHWRQMLDALPLNALMAVDAGFVGYDYVKAAIDGGRHLLLRVGSNVKLLRQLGYARECDAIVYLWPDRAAKKSLPPLRLRLLVGHNGKHPVYLVTSLSDAREWPDQRIIELYRQRWGIELFYRHLKQTYQRRKLRSTSAGNARVELEWSLVGLWAMALYAEVELARRNVPARRISVARVLRAFRRVLRNYSQPLRQRGDLCRELQRAIVDAYQRPNKTSRCYPRKKQEQPPGPPQILPATKLQRHTARPLLLKRLTA